MIKLKSMLNLLVFILLSCTSKEQAKPEIIEKTERAPKTVARKSDLPAMNLFMLDGNRLSAKDLQGKVALILFFPDCDHCQREAADIYRNIEGFKNYQLYFISSATADEISAFAKDYKLAGLPNVFFGRTEIKDVLDNFGAIETPSLYLYGDAGELIQSFNGEVAIEVVLKYI